MTKESKQQQLVADMADLFNKISAYNKPIMEQALPGLTLSEIEVLELMVTIEDANVTKLAERYYMTRGAISKITKKMQTKELIETYQYPDNKKEVYFKLTSKGIAVERKHRRLHEFFYQRDKQVFKHVSEKTVDDMLSFLETYSTYMDGLKTRSS
ncbi:MarR family winged helix-turn-helix transcriptional regulator [Oenococcus sicerae]|uniref:MarR family transcriptional regulator n=1 Tax=Oenococcus sicerae TaxID=2203724 RepID=A0AAJ1VNU3_9LACO|nr:MarR family transcriptional regulator [Oenococcus sicerae]MDN6900589.1 MarR family transcriptional regulator [Oenococcus sicerae]